MAKEKFTKKFIEDRKNNLLELKEAIESNFRQHPPKKELHVEPDEIMEEGDLVQTHLNQNLTCGLQERELQKLREIQEALFRIENGNYGICEESGDPIEKKRLERIPWTRFSMEVASELENDKNVNLPFKKRVA